MRISPLSSLHVTLRIFAKAVALLLVANFLCVALKFYPITALLNFNTWWLTGHGRPRLVYPSDFQNGQLPVEALLAAHALAYTPKAPDEYRVLVLGESGIAGWGLPDQDTFTAQLTVRNLKTDTKRVVAYNLAYPSPSVARDVLILDAALNYHADLIIWFISPAALDDAPNAIGTNSVLFDLNRARLERLTTRYQLQEWFNSRMAPEPVWQPWLAIKSQDALPVWLNALFYPFVAPDLGLTTRRIGSEPIPAKARYTTGRTGFEALPNQTWRFLDVGRDLATQHGARLLLVNEPMLIGSGPNSDMNYNLQYERAFYESYRNILKSYVTTNGFQFVDLWDAIPAASFTDTPMHADAAGYAALTDKIAAELNKVNSP